MLSDMYVIDGCAFAEEDFTGVTQKVKDSPLTAFFLTTPGEDQGMLALAHNIGGIYNMADDPASGLMVVRTIAELEQAKAQGKIGVILGFQNPHCIENSLEKLRALYELGIRVVQMTYNKANYIGSGCLETKDSGLTDFGRQALKAMKEDPLMEEILGRRFLKIYNQAKEKEWMSYMEQISMWELEQYLYKI